MHSPVLETRRLFLRRPTTSDIGTVLARMKAGGRHVATAPLAGNRALEQVVPIVCHWDLCGLGLFAVVPKGCDDPIGLAGPWKATGWDMPELGFHFADTPDVDSLAPEGLRAARRFAEKGVGWREILSHVTAEDRRAAALLRATGAIADPFSDGPSDVLTFVHPVRAARWNRAA
jgi:RimJ/RimL family protein N-acetyltransferase